MAHRIKILRLRQTFLVCSKFLYDCRKTFKAFACRDAISGKFKRKFVKYFVLSGALVDIDEISRALPEDCLKYIKPPPERKMLLVANLKMNGSMKRLKQYSECINKSIACAELEKAKKINIRNYKKQIFPDLVDIVIAPPYPYVEAMSNWLRKDCLKCQDCDGCTDCSRCVDCIDCADCNDCKCNNCDECCQNKCLSFCKCDPDGVCNTESGNCSISGVCECENCDLCEYCQTCFKKDCAECSNCVQTAAQNAFAYLSGGLSGEVTPRQLRELGARWVIIGNTERRELFGETDELLAHKLRCALMARMQVVYCVYDSCPEDPCDEIENQLNAVIPKIGVPGKTNDSGNPHKTEFKMKKKNKMEILEVSGMQDWSKVAIAYEPLWAIKDGLVLTPDEAEEKCKKIRDIIKTNVSNEAAKKVRILYGGPVDPDIAPEFADKPSIDGFMLGCSAFKLDHLIPIANSWYIKNRQDITDIGFDLFGEPDLCIKDPNKEKGLKETCEEPIEEKPISEAPKLEKKEPKCRCAKDKDEANSEATKSDGCPEAPKRDPRCARCNAKTDTENKSSSPNCGPPTKESICMRK